MTHAMAFTAYDKAPGEELPSKWRVENVRPPATPSALPLVPSSAVLPRVLLGASLRCSTRSHVLRWLCLVVGAQSWGRAAANDGYYVMTKEWFEEWMYQVAIDVSMLSEDVSAILAKPAEVLPAWDPMGSLAGGHDDDNNAVAVTSRL